jgi:hypothetical protein
LAYVLNPVWGRYFLRKHPHEGGIVIREALEFLAPFYVYVWFGIALGVVAVMLVVGAVIEWPARRRERREAAEVQAAAADRQLAWRDQVDRLIGTYQQRIDAEPDRRAELVAAFDEELLAIRQHRSMERDFARVAKWVAEGRPAPAATEDQ